MNLQPKLLAACAATAVLLAGCGGGGDSIAPIPVTDAVPSSASQSAAGLQSYLTELNAASADTKAPVDLSNFDPAKPDNTEPVDI